MHLMYIGNKRFNSNAASVHCDLMKITWGYEVGFNT